MPSCSVSRIMQIRRYMLNLLFGHIWVALNYILNLLKQYLSLVRYSIAYIKLKNTIKHDKR